MMDFYNIQYAVFNGVQENKSIGDFRNSQSDVIFTHAHIHGHQRYGQLESVLNVGLYFEKNGLL